ncbi:predicted protein [Candida tropicalis MYA-3404]|uniref:Uncharacterized protein n=1 Tax=Candida tropicalis (strain ATCC MYA-3404 / T1) TaxID=294747 RepID=C5MF10_CANTT|nr:predicted protein [Candida tropicalis MYA-3404]EER31870.1 predicted protein [Candida tropicalis MYA-3404]KAG4405455.1 hypothetical protein JTP64_005491 [Candida tropicalis]
MEQINGSNNGTSTAIVDRMSETEHWNNDVNDFTPPSSDTAFDPIQQQEIEEFQRLLERELRSMEDDKSLKGKNWNCVFKTLIFIGYCISTIIFSLHLWVQYFFIKYTYDDQTAVNMLNYVTAAQEKAIDEYSKRKGGDKESQD